MMIKIYRLSIDRKKETLTEGVPVTAEYIYNTNYGTIFMQIALFLLVISLVSRKMCRWKMKVHFQVSLQANTE